LNNPTKQSVSCAFLLVNNMNESLEIWHK